jgi:Tol biopolymer transport system component
MSRFLIIASAALLASGCNSGSPRNTANAQGVRQAGTTPTMTRRVLSTNGPLSWTGIAPDGRTAAVVDWDTGNLALQDLATSKVRVLTHQAKPYEKGEVDWGIMSRDGGRVAYVWDSFVAETPSELRIVDSSGRGERAIYGQKNRFPWPVDWAGDGRSVLIVSGTPARDTSELVLVPVAGGTPAVVARFSWPSPRNASLSPDGRFIAYDRGAPGSEGSRDVFVVDVAHGQSTPVFSGASDDLLFGWSRGGDYLLIRSDRGGTPAAWVQTMRDGKPQGEPQLVKPDMWRASALGFARDDVFFYTVTTGTHGLFTVTVDATTAKPRGPVSPVPQSFIEAHDTNLEWSPDGRSIAYRVSRPNAGGSSIVFRSLETGQIREITPAVDLIFASEMRWTRDAGSLVVLGSQQTRRGLYRVDVQTGNTTPLVTVGADTTLNGFDLAPDGQSLAYRISTQPKGVLSHCLLILRDLRTARDRVLDDDRCVPAWGSSIAAFAPDGKSIAFFHSGPGTLQKPMDVAPVLAIAHLDGSATAYPSPAVNVNTTSFSLAWTGAGDAVLMWRANGNSRDNQHKMLWRIPVSGGAPAPLGVTAVGPMSRFRLSPDGSRLLFDSGEVHDELWSMKDFAPHR